MQLVIQNGIVIATHDDSQNIVGLYPGATILPVIGQYKVGDPSPTFNLAQAQAIKIQAIQAAWNAKEDGGFPYLGKTIQSDPRTVQRINYARIGAEAAIAAGQASVYSGNWLCADGSLLPLTAQQAVDMATAYSMFGLGLYNHAQALFLQVLSATTADQVNQIPNW